MGKIIAILPAYNAKNTFKAVVDSLPRGVFSHIVLSDDGSGDGTFEAAKRDKRLTVIQTPKNLGYGGNLKYSLSTAIAMGADIVVEIHPDGEYLPDGILPALEKVNNGAHLVLGNRFIGRGEGMYRWKQIGTKVLTNFDNLLLKTPCGDLHQGFRVYTKTLLTQVPYKSYANDYLFSFEIIVDATRSKLRVDEVPVGTRYTGSKRGAFPKAAVVYSLKTFGVLARLVSNYQSITREYDKNIQCSICESIHTTYLYHRREFTSIYKCYACGSGFTYPLKWDASTAYPEAYYANTSLVYLVKSAVYSWFQGRRVLWAKNYCTPGSRIIDVGAGEGLFEKQLGTLYNVISLEAPFAHVVNKKVVKTITEPSVKIGTIDAVTFWQSFEHMDNPKEELHRILRFLKPGGLIMIEYPRFDSWESKWFLGRWYHLDIPRHRTHFSAIGLEKLVASTGVEIVLNKSIPAYEYSVIGIASSVIGWTPDDLLSKLNKPVWGVIMFPILLASCIVELLSALSGQSPIGLLIARKH